MYHCEVSTGLLVLCCRVLLALSLSFPKTQETLLVLLFYVVAFLLCISFSMLCVVIVWTAVQS